MIRNFSLTCHISQNKYNNIFFFITQESGGGWQVNFFCLYKTNLTEAISPAII